MMTRAAAPPILEQLQSAESASAQITALRALKNELIGHDQRKEALAAEGIIPALSQVLTSRWPATNQNESALPQDRSTQKSPEDCEACLQATLVVGSLAQGM
jgi:type II secretory pathway pseudopilin PulG